MFKRENLKEFVDHFTNRYKLYVSGSYRRKEQYINDLDFLTYDNIDDLYNKIKDIYNITLIAKGNKYVSFKLFGPPSIEINIWKIDKKNQMFEKIARNYKTEYVIWMRSQARNMNLKLNNSGLYKDDKKINVKTPRNLFKILQLPYKNYISKKDI